MIMYEVTIWFEKGNEKLTIYDKKQFENLISCFEYNRPMRFISEYKEDNFNVTHTEFFNPNKIKFIEVKERRIK